MATVQTINATVAQIEDMLRTGQAVEAVARELQEPRNNVIAVWRAMQNGGATLPTPAPPAGTRPLTSVPTNPTAVSSAALTVDALVNAAARSTSKRTQALGVKLFDLANDLRARLAAERTAAERAERESREREVARAEVERLEAQLREARAKLTGRKVPRAASPRTRKGGISDEQRAKMLAGQKNDTPCAKGCGYVAKTKSGKSAHERNCDGGAS